MDENQILIAINKTKKGVEQYLEIMRLFSITNVAQDENFQRKYNAFYRVRQRDENWYKVYYQLMEEKKGQNIVRLQMVLDKTCQKLRDGFGTHINVSCFFSKHQKVVLFLS
jgi:adenosine deaminase